MFGFHRKKEEKIEFDPSVERIVIRSSICTGEKSGCIQNLKTKKLTGVMLIRNQEDMEKFCRMTGMNPDEIEQVY